MVVVILNFPIIGLLVSTNELGFPSGKKRMLLRKFLHNFVSWLSSFTRNQFLKGKKDQTPLPFVLYDGKTYDKTGADEVWVASEASGEDKRQYAPRSWLFSQTAEL